MKVGLYFGSFNPIHIGHLIIAKNIIENKYLDEVWFVVSPQNPFKQENTLLNSNHRLGLIKLAIESENKIKASKSSAEIKKSGSQFKHLNTKAWDANSSEIMKELIVQMI